MENKTTPLTFNIDLDTIAAIDMFKDRTNSESTSAIMRDAIERYNFDQTDTSATKAKQVSLRLDSQIRAKLKAAAKSQGVSIGSLIRECIMNFVAEDQVNPQPRVGISRSIKMEEPATEENTHPWQI